VFCLSVASSDTSVTLTRQDLRFSQRWLWRMAFSGMLHHLALVRTNLLEECIASIIKVERINKPRTTLAVTSNVSPKHRVLQEPHCITSQKTTFFIVNVVKTSNLIQHYNHIHVLPKWCYSYWQRCLKQQAYQRTIYVHQQRCRITICTPVSAQDGTFLSTDTCS
jgi:hypothetical protein